MDSIKPNRMMYQVFYSSELLIDFFEFTYSLRLKKKNVCIFDFSNNEEVFPLLPCSIMADVRHGHRFSSGLAIHWTFRASLNSLHSHN